MASEASVDDRDVAELARSLAALKRRGCWLLVAGRAADSEHGHACERLLGEDGEHPRRRVLVEAAVDGRASTPAGAGSTTTRIEVAGGQARHAETVSPNSATGLDSAGAPGTRVPRSDLPALEAACRDRVATIEQSTDLAPAELRLCVDTLVPLVEANGLATVASFLESVGDRVRAARGMGHVHLPVARDSDVVAELSPLFDAVVGVRTRCGRVEHRWHVREADVSSGWLEL